MFELCFKMTKLDEKGALTDWQRIYYEGVMMGTNEFRGSASSEDLRQKLRTSNCKTLMIKFCDSEVHISSELNIMLDDKYIPSKTVCKLQIGCSYKLRIDFLYFQIEVIEY